MAAFVLNEETSQLIVDIKNLDKKFRKSCDQILLLNNQIEDLQVRYERAMKSNRRSFRYSLRLRLATLEGVRNMFYEYASRCADSLELLQTQLVDSGGREELYDESVEWEPIASSDEDEDIPGNGDNLDQSTDSVNSQSENSLSQVAGHNSNTLPPWHVNTEDTDTSDTDVTDSTSSSSSSFDDVMAVNLQESMQESTHSANAMDATINAPHDSNIRENVAYGDSGYLHDTSVTNSAQIKTDRGQFMADNKLGIGNDVIQP